MTPIEIKNLIDQKIAGQGTMVDVGGALPTILKEIVDMASDTPAPQKSLRLVEIIRAPKEGTSNIWQLTEDEAKDIADGLTYAIDVRREVYPPRILYRIGGGISFSNQYDDLETAIGELLDGTDYADYRVGAMFGGANFVLEDGLYTVNSYTIFALCTLSELTPTGLVFKDAIMFYAEA